MGYAVNTAGTEMITGFKITPAGMFGYDHTYYRAYLKFNITSPPFSLGEIDSVVLRMRCTRVAVDYKDARLRSAGAGANWGTTLEASSGDWDSTNTELEDDVEIVGTGSYDFAVDKNNLNLSGYTWFRFSYPTAGGENNIVWASQNHGTSAYRPQLIVTYTPAGTFIPKVMIF